MTTSYIIGTAEDCDVRVSSEYASPHHARVSRDGTGRWWVEDLGSTNGTQLRRGGRDYRVTVRQPLVFGDVIIVGRVQIPWARSAAEVGRHEPIRVVAEVGPRREEDV